MNKTWVWIIIAVVVLIPIAWYLASPLFIDKVVDEGLPENVNNTGGNVVEEMMDEKFEPELTGNFIDADSFHKTSGVAKIINAEEQIYLRLEDFETTNGPDLYVYLSNDLDAKDFVSLGRLKGNIGNQNYEIPNNVNPEDYQYALIWCKQFSTLFGSAELK